MAWMAEHPLLKWHNEVTLFFIERVLGADLPPEWRRFWTLPCITAALEVMNMVDGGGTGKETFLRFRRISIRKTDITLSP